MCNLTLNILKLTSNFKVFTFMLESPFCKKNLEKTPCVPATSEKNPGQCWCTYRLEESVLPRFQLLLCFNLFTFVCYVFMLILFFFYFISFIFTFFKHKFKKYKRLTPLLKVRETPRLVLAPFKTLSHIYPLSTNAANPIENFKYHVNDMSKAKIPSKTRKILPYANTNPSPLLLFRKWVRLYSCIIRSLVHSHPQNIGQNSNRKKK